MGNGVETLGGDGEANEISSKEILESSNEECQILKESVQAEKPMYLSNQVVVERANYIKSQGKKSFAEMYGTTQPNNFNGKQVGKYTKLDIARIDKLLIGRAPNPKIVGYGGPEYKHMSIESIQDGRDLAKETKKLYGEIKNLSYEAEKKLGKNYKSEDFFSAPIDGKIISVSIKETNPTFAGHYNHGIPNYNREVKITVKDPKNGNTARCSIATYETPWTRDDMHIHYKITANEKVVQEKNHNLDHKNWNEKNEYREDSKKFLGLAYRVIAQYPTILDQQVKKYTPVVEAEKKAKEDKALQEKQKKQKAEADLKKILTGQDVVANNSNKIDQLRVASAEVKKYSSVINQQLVLIKKWNEELGLDNHHWSGNIDGESFYAEENQFVEGYDILFNVIDTNKNVISYRVDLKNDGVDMRVYVNDIFTPVTRICKKAEDLTKEDMKYVKYFNTYNEKMIKKFPEILASKYNKDKKTIEARKIQQAKEKKKLEDNKNVIK